MVEPIFHSLEIGRTGSLVALTGRFVEEGKQKDRKELQPIGSGAGQNGHIVITGFTRNEATHKTAAIDEELVTDCRFFPERMHSALI
jgi:hypothetical protein